MNTRENLQSEILSLLQKLKSSDNLQLIEGLYDECPFSLNVHAHTSPFPAFTCPPTVLFPERPLACLQAHPAAVRAPWRRKAWMQVHHARPDPGCVSFLPAERPQ